MLVDVPDGTSVEARALLDYASSAAFISECLTQSLFLPRSSQNLRISGVAGLSHGSHGIMGMEPKIQLIALPEAYSLLSYLCVSCGGEVQNGCDLHLRIGPSKHLFHQLRAQRKKGDYVYSLLQFPNHHSCQLITIPVSRS